MARRRRRRGKSKNYNRGGANKYQKSKKIRGYGNSRGGIRL